MFFFAVVALVALLLQDRADAQVCLCFLEGATPQVLQLPPNQTREATGPGGEVVTFSLSASDNVDDDVPNENFPAASVVPRARISEL
jgi:hypothetical protein